MSYESYESPYSDDSEISDDEIVYRRVHPNHILWDKLDEEGRPKIGKSAFSDASQQWVEANDYPGRGMSVHLGSRLNPTEDRLEQLLDDPSSGLVKITVGDIREHDQGIEAIPEAYDPSHAVVFSLRKEKRTQGQEKRVREAAEWVIVPERP